MTSTFPVTWDDPGDAAYTWNFERMHAPEPMTLADAVAFQCAFDHGVTAAARAYGVPFRAHDAPHQHLPVPRPRADDGHGPASRAMRTG